MNAQRHSRAAPSAVDENTPTMGSLPSIPLGKGSIEQAVFGARRASVLSQGSGRLSNGLPPANSTMRMTGSKSGRALEEFEIEPCGSGPAESSKLEERPKKKLRNCVNEHFIRSPAPSPTPTRVTRAMVARQVEEATTPTRVTRSASKRLAELANTPRSSYDGAARRSKSLKRL
ncbi:hypothetical protein BDV93DRAFT_524901 [Ceratobasidium sp. AG-I]|nr:hypothetical protein BDV93DRAFT_524901 [Ceratobasidium sp. AG-I]